MFFFFRTNTVSCQVLCQFSLCLTVVDDTDFSSDLCNYVSVILVFFSFFVSYVFFISLFRTNMSCDICLKQFSAGRRQQVIPCKATKCHINIHRECYPVGMDAVTFVYNKKNNLFDFECAKCSLVPDHTPVVPIQPSNQSAIKKGRGRPKKKEEPPTTSPSAIQPTKRGRGRPKKRQEPTTTSPPTMQPPITASPPRPTIFEDFFARVEEEVSSPIHMD
jgi:hypothetical protein